MIRTGYLSGNQPPIMEAKKDFANAPPVVPQTRSANVSERIAYFTSLGQRNIEPAVTQKHMGKAAKSPKRSSSVDSGIGSDSEPSPTQTAPPSTTSKNITQTTATVRYSQEFKGSHRKPLPPQIKVTSKALNDTAWLDQFLSKDDQQWVEVLFAQKGQGYYWEKRQPPGLDPQQPFDIILKPSQAYKVIMSGQQQHAVSKTCHYQWFDRSALKSPDQQVLSIYQGKRPAATFELTSTLDPRIGSADLFPGLVTRILKNPFGQGVTVILERRNDSLSISHANRLEALVKKEWQQAQADIARGVPKEISLLRSRIRNLPKRGELELIRSDSIRREVIHAKEQLSAYNQSISHAYLTPDQLVARKQAIQQRVTERFNKPDVIQKKLLSLSSRKHQSKQTPEQLRKGDRALQVHRGIDDYERQLSRKIPLGQGASEREVSLLLKKNENLKNELLRIIQEQNGELDVAEIDSLKSKIQEFKNDQALLFQVLDSPALPAVAGKISWQGAMEFRRVGYDLNDEVTLPGPWSDQLLDPDIPPRVLGSGNENTVYLLSYKTEKGRTSRVFKPEPAVDNSAWRSIISPESYHDQDHPNLTARNLAAGQIANWLGMDVMPEMSFCEHNHQIGLEMELASGHSANSLIPSTTNPGKMKKLGYQQLIQNQGNRNIKNKILSGLADLELLDAICAQPDRHGDNFFIDYTTGRVVGIDNDTCLYPFRDIIAPSADNKYAEWRKGCRVGYPRLMTRKSYDRLQKLDAELLCESLPACFGLTVKNALKERITLIQQHSRALFYGGRIVDDWQTWCDPTTKEPATMFLTLSMEDIVKKERTALKEEAIHIQPLLSKYYSNEKMTDSESNSVNRYFWKQKLLSNDEVNQKHAISISYFATTIF